MFSGKVTAAVVAASVALGQVQPALADGDALVGGIIGGIIGGAIVNEVNKGKRTTTRTVRRTVYSGQTSAQREANREVQTSLNYFGFPVGTPDGSIGPRSRAAISEYQAVLGYAPTGQLTEYERMFLVGSYQRALAGGPLTMQQIAANPMGPRGLLMAYRDEAAGVQPQVAAAPAPLANTNGAAVQAQEPAQPVVPAPEPGATMAAATAAPVTVPADGGTPALPSFLGAATASVSLASECNRISLVTSTNGGYTTAASMGDPMAALGEQFCLARGYAITLGEDLMKQVAGFTPAQIAAQCQGFGPAMREQIAALSLKPAPDVLAGVGTFVLSTGMSPVQLAGTARVCLGVGYSSDDMNVAIASALILAGLGEGAYGELLGHHLSQGFGTTPRPDLALAWYEMGLEAAGPGAKPVFAPGQPERLDLIRKAAFTVGGMPEKAELPEAVPATLPSFVAPATEGVAPATVTVAQPVPPQSVPETTLAQTQPVAAGDGGSLVSGGVSALVSLTRLPSLLLGN